jgi:hypothetical protein
MLLHIGNTAAQWATWDPWVIGVGIALFLAVALFIWSPRAHGAFRRRALRGIGVRIAACAAAVAIAPAIVPYDHLFPMEATTTQTQTGQEAHAQHCHGSPGSCSDAPLTSGSGQFLTSDPLLVEPALALMLLIVATPLLIGLTVRPAVRPPLNAAAI